MWDVVLFLYDFTGQRPRAREEGARVSARRRDSARSRAGARRACARRRRRRSARSDAQRAAGRRALPEALLAVPRREGRRQRHRGAARCCRAPRDFTRASSRSARRRAARCRPTHDLRGSHPRGHALHLDAGLEPTSPTPSSHELVYYVKTLLARLRRRRAQAPTPIAIPDGARAQPRSRRRRASKVYARIGCARLPRRARPRRRHLGARR